MLCALIAPYCAKHFFLDFLDKTVYFEVLKPRSFIAFMTVLHFSVFLYGALPCSFLRNISLQRRQAKTWYPDFVLKNVCFRAAPLVPKEIHKRSCRAMSKSGVTIPSWRLVQGVGYCCCILAAVFHFLIWSIAKDCFLFWEFPLHNVVCTAH